MALEALKGNGESILVVDDIKEQRHIASQLLSILGYTVNTVENCEEAVEFVRRHKVDLLVLDMIRDPGMDGLDAYRLKNSGLAVKNELQQPVDKRG